MKPSLPLYALIVVAAAGVLPACTATVYHPTKNNSEMQADVRLCTRESNRRYWMDPVAALYHAYDCLEAKGYSRNEHDFAARVERALGEREGVPAANAASSGGASRAAPGPVRPCAVPCRRRNQ
jgi:hypothetical protein